MPTKTTTNVSTLKINYLTQAMYDAALAGGELNENELYFTPDDTFDKFYPVGSYYETSDTTFNPNSAWSGTWEEVDGTVITGSGTGVSLLTYTTSSNMYTAPHDGVIRIICGYQASNAMAATIYNDDGTTIAWNGVVGTSSANNTGNPTVSIPIFKGQKVYVTKTGSSSTSTAAYLPYTYATKRWHRIA